MRLINVKTYIIEEFFGDRIPKYAILSHTWGDEEVTFQDMQNIQRGNLVPYQSPEAGVFSFNQAIIAKEGFLKIEFTCRQARKDGLLWAWIDTCCIDKTSSSELTEAINSMFQWYRDSFICYAYLLDVAVVQHQDTVSRGRTVRRYFSRELPPTFAKSRWFTRVWTLQELLAPTKMTFFGRLWAVIGSREEHAEAVHHITGIPTALFELRPGYLHDLKCVESNVLSDYSIAQRMSWMAARQCTRLEDTAYCLLGIFGINMPLLYGEGSRAFIRLQEEIWKETDDHSILAWAVPQQSPKAWNPGGVFAESPELFARSGHIVRLNEEMGDPSVITKKGLQISLHLLKKKIHRTSSLFWRYQPWGMFYAALYCGPRGKVNSGFRIVLLLLKEASVEEGSDAGRERCYTRLVTPTHIRVGDEAAPSDPSLYQTVFLRTHRHKLMSPLAFTPLNDVILHIHNIPQLYLQHLTNSYDTTGEEGYRELKKLAEQVSDTGLEVEDSFFGYITDTFSYRTNGFLGYDPRCNTIIAARGDYFILKLELRGHSRRQIPVTVLFGFHKAGKGLLRLELSTEDDIICPNVRITDEVNITRCKGDLTEAWIRAGQAWIRAVVHCEHVWEWQRAAGAGRRIHIHLIFTSHFERNPSFPQQAIQAWRITNFEQLMEESLRRTGEYEAYRLQRYPPALRIGLLGPGERTEVSEEYF